MFTKLKEYSGLIALVAILLAIVIPSPVQRTLGNATASFQDAIGGFRVNGTEVVSSAAVVDAPSVNSASITFNSGTAVTGYSCATTSWSNPGNLGVIGQTTSTASTTLSLPGVVVGDVCNGSLTTATSTSIRVTCNIYQNGSSSIQISNLGAAATGALATGTAKTCYTH